MANKSQILYHGAHYTACLMKNGDLIITSNRIQKGRAIPANMAAPWIAAFREEMALDGELKPLNACHDLCKAIMAD